jgi:hypothetical protein
MPEAALSTDEGDVVLEDTTLELLSNEYVREEPSARAQEAEADVKSMWDSMHPSEPLGRTDEDTVATMYGRNTPR